jgi:hypothetical protein
MGGGGKGPAFCCILKADNQFWNVPVSGNVVYLNELLQPMCLMKKNYLLPSRETKNFFPSIELIHKIQNTAQSMSCNY